MVQKLRTLAVLTEDPGIGQHGSSYLSITSFPVNQTPSHRHACIQNAIHIN